MGVGTSLGTYYDDEFHYQQSQWDSKYDNNVIDPGTTPDLNTNDNNSKPAVPETPKVIQASEGGAKGPVEPAGALKSSGGTIPTPGENSSVRPPQELPDINDVPHHDWIEKLGKGIYESAKSALTAPGDAMAGRFDPSSEEGVRRALDMAGWMVGAPAPVASKLADGTLGSFAGVVSKTVDKEKLAIAQLEKSLGVHPDKVWEHTGFFQGADNRWKYEIPDKDSTLNPNAFHKNEIASDPRTGGEANTTYTLKADVGEHLWLEDVLNHPELYKAYPELKGIKVGQNFNPNSIGSFNSTSNTLKIAGDLDPEYTKGVILHEVQHWIQEKEGFAKGSSPAMFLPKVYNETKQAYEEALQQGSDPNSPILKTAKKLMTEAENQSLKQYNRVKGEVEARNVQTRRTTPPEILKKWPPNLSEDKPRSLQIDAPTVQNDLSR